MSLFKIFGSKDDKSVILRGAFNEYKDYNELKKKIIDSSQKAKKKEFKIKESDKFILSFFEDKKDIYFPKDLDQGIFNNKTFFYLKEKLTLHGVGAETTYKFAINKVDKYPKWKKKENHEFLKEALDSSWGPIHDDIIAGVNLSKLEESKINYQKMKDELKKNEKLLNKEIHKNVICNNCFKKDIKGKRFICAECNNYNLCQDCEQIFYQKQIHQREHTLIQVNKALSDENMDDLYNYSNIIGNNNQEFKNVPSSFQLEINFINNGENDLKDCYILPVRFGDEYLKCNPKVITDEVQRSVPVKISLVVRVPQNNKGYFEGYFRMFTPHGLPFGDVLCVKVLNGE